MKLLKKQEDLRESQLKGPPPYHLGEMDGTPVAELEGTEIPVEAVGSGVRGESTGAQDESNGVQAGGGGVLAEGAKDGSKDRLLGTKDKEKPMHL